MAERGDLNALSDESAVNGTHLRSHPHHSSSSRRSSYQPFPPLSPGPSDPATVPVRLPRPLTPGEMHMELEREQEAIVNRLTREITALQTAATTAAARRASTASNTSNVGPPTPIDAARSGSVAMARTGSAAGTREEVDSRKAELEEVKRENDMLKARVRELEGLLRRKREEVES